MRQKLAQFGVVRDRTFGARSRFRVETVAMNLLHMRWLVGVLAIALTVLATSCRTAMRGPVDTGNTGCREPSATIVNGVGMTLIRIPPGSATLGSSELPLFAPREYVFSAIAYIGAHEVTVAQYSLFDPHCLQYLPEEVRSSANPNLPICGITWAQADAYCKWLSLREGRRYRLPYADEWEYCAKAGSDQTFPWGDAWPPEAARVNLHFKDAMDERLDDDGFESIAPVGTFSANAWGIHDLGGNVSEWCQDAWVAWPQAGLDLTSRDWQWVAQYTRLGYRVKCGPGWNWIVIHEPGYKPYCSVAYRAHMDLSGTPHGYTGFRVVLDR